MSHRLETLSLHFNSGRKKKDIKDCNNYWVITLISHACILDHHIDFPCKKSDVQNFTMKTATLYGTRNARQSIQFRNRRSTIDQIENLQRILEHTNQRVSEENQFMFYSIHESFWLCGSWKAIYGFKRNPVPQHLMFWKAYLK